MNLKLSSYIIIPNVPVDNQKNYLVYSTRTGVSIAINENTLIDLRNNIYTNLTDELKQKFIDTKVIVESHENEFESVINIFNDSKKTNTNLSFVIAPSENCQLGCNYCGQLHNKNNMDEKLEVKIINHIVKKIEFKAYKDFDIVWYGGEPLLGIKSIKRITTELRKLCESKKITYNASMITNGLNLNYKNFEDLVLNMKVKTFQITIDGTKETHDKSRHTKENKPTFDIIMKNIINAINSPIYNSENVSISIRVNIHKNNFNEIDDFIQSLFESNLHNKIYLNFAAVHDWGKNEADEKIGLSQNEFAEMEINWLIKMNDLGFKKSNLLPMPISNTCMTTTDDSELIDATGKVSYCWEVPYTDEFIKNNNLTIGNLNDASGIDYDKNSPLRDWFNDIKNDLNNSSNCKNCVLLPVCGGSCPISWYKGKPACPPFKFNIEDKLIMEYLSMSNKL